MVAEKIYSKLARAFLLQVGFVSLAAVLGVFAAKLVLEDLLIRQALSDEAAYFWQRYHSDPGIPLPDTKNMGAYLLPRQQMEQIPEELRELPPGFHKLSKGAAWSAAFVSLASDVRLILVFDGQRVEKLALFFGLFPLMGVLIVIYTAALISYRLSRRAVSPVFQLAEEVSRIDPHLTDEALCALENLPTTTNDEVLALSEALAGLAGRLRRFIERERVFTRDVSHELRSPITVIHIAADMLLTDSSLVPASRDKALRIKRATRDMEELTDAFLQLARESERGTAEEFLCINTIAAEELELARPLLSEKPVELTLVANGRLYLTASVKVVSSLMGNLLRNACTHTHAGFVRIAVDRQSLSVEDSGVGIAKEQIDQIFRPFVRGPEGGYGVGLAIVKRITERFDWPIEIDSMEGKGTRVTIYFPQSRFEPF